MTCSTHLIIFSLILYKIDWYDWYWLKSWIDTSLKWNSCYRNKYILFTHCYNTNDWSNMPGYVSRFYTNRLFNLLQAEKHWYMLNNCGHWNALKIGILTISGPIFHFSLSFKISANEAIPYQQWPILLSYHVSFPNTKEDYDLMS